MVRRHWVRALAGNGRETGMSPIGRGRVSAPFLRSIILRTVDHLLETGHVAVAVLGGNGKGADEPLGWIAFNDRKLHFVYVLGPARRRGVGTLLLTRTVPADAEPTFMTKLGEALISSIVAGYHDKDEDHGEHETEQATPA